MCLGESLREEDTFALIPRVEEVMTKFLLKKNPNSQEICASFFSMTDGTGSPERKENKSSGTQRQIPHYGQQN